MRQKIKSAVSSTNTIIKPIFKEGVGKRGKSSLIGKVSGLKHPSPP